MHTERLAVTVAGDAEVLRHRVQHDPLRAIGPRRAPGRKVLDGIAEPIDQTVSLFFGMAELISSAPCGSCDQPDRTPPIPAAANVMAPTNS